jgi:hypothetical protein
MATLISRSSFPVFNKESDVSKQNVVSIVERNNKIYVRVSDPENRHDFKEALVTNKEKIQIAKTLLSSANV